MVEEFDYTPHLSSRLLTLTPLRPEDWDALFAVASDPLIWALHPASTRYQEGVFRRFFDDAFADQGGLVARDRASGEVIGFSRYSQTRVEPGEVEIGWTFLARAYWGQGHNREMKRLMLTHAFRFVDQVIFRIGERTCAPAARSRRSAAGCLSARIWWRSTAAPTGTFFTPSPPTISPPRPWSRTSQPPDRRCPPSGRVSDTAVKTVR